MRICITFLLLFNFILASSQKPSGVLFNSSYFEFNVIDCFKTENYIATFSSDSLKANSIFNGHTIWRTISLDNINNQQLFNSTNKCTQIGLFEIIKFGLFEKRLNAFSSDNFNNTKNSNLNKQQLLQLIYFIDSTEIIAFDSKGIELKTMVIQTGYLLGRHIKSYLLKENWFINSYSGKLEKKIVGIAPLILNKKTEKIIPLFWLYFNEWQSLFALFEAKNYICDNKISYKDVFINNYFISKISKENNLSNRSINSTNKGKDNVIESELIKEKINNQEADLFQY